jgi:type VI secretion system secreted protein VgrG
MQYGESDLAFVSRLCEHAGISFFFEHDGERDKLVFTDHPAGFLPIAGPSEVPFHGAGETLGVFFLDRASHLAPTSHIVHDYNYRSPQVAVSACSDLSSGHGGGVVEYGTHAKTPDEATQLSLVRMEERRSVQTVIEGKSGVAAFSAGATVDVTELPDRSGPEKWLLVEVTHEGLFPLMGESAEGTHYRNGHRAMMQSGFTYRPPRITPRPTIAGVVTGVVQPGPTGEIGGVADVDSDGRYTVVLHLDTADLGGKKASHPMRMAQPFAGPGYGMHFPLRRGTEVLVAFTNGDPDRPLIVGALYNTTSPNPVVGSNAAHHQIRGSTGAVFEFVSKT